MPLPFWRENNPDTIIVARQSSPLVIGIGDNEFFLASDATPFVEYTKEAVYLKDGEIAEIRRGEPLKITDLDNNDAEIDVTTLEMSISPVGEGWLSALHAEGNLRTAVDIARLYPRTSSGRWQACNHQRSDG